MIRCRQNSSGHAFLTGVLPSEARAEFLLKRDDQRMAPGDGNREWQCDGNGVATGLRTATGDGQVFRAGWWKD